MNARKLLSAANAVETAYVEDVFSTYLYTGNSSTQTITNGINLAGNGGLVWIKQRNGTNTHSLWDSARGLTRWLNTVSTAAQSTLNIGLAFNSNGFSFSTNDFLVNAGTGSLTYTSWTFRKQEKFFDVVTYTGDGANRTIAHNLGSVPGCIIVKRTDVAADWQVYHRANTANPETDYLVLNSTNATVDSVTRWNNTLPTSTVFSLGTDATVNANGGTYVAYLFAHDAGGFGVSGADNVISCGSFTTDGGGNAAVTLGYEPQWLLVKSSSASSDWQIVDVIRRWADGTVSEVILNANTTTSEYALNRGWPTATGFQASLASSQTYIYIAIRRGPMKTPTSGTSVFDATTTAGTGVVVDTGFPVDLNIYGFRAGNINSQAFNDRLRGVWALDSAVASPTLKSASTDAENTGIETQSWNNTGFTTPSSLGASLVHWSFRRAPGFFDVVCYTGTGSATTFNHNLGVVPELMIVKKRSATDAWIVYANNDNTDYLVLNTTAATVDDNTIWNDTSPTASVFTVGTNDDVNGNTATFVAYLFATCPGVSKVGSYTGTGNTLQIDCGFTGGARFVLIKRTDSTGDWYVWDSARGIVAGNDPYLLLNSTAAEVTTTDWVDTHSPGFELSNAVGNNANINTASYIFLAIA